MPAYTVTLPATTGLTKKHGADTVVVFAENAADAKAIAKSRFDGDGSASWDAATVTEVAAAADLEGWRLRVQIVDLETPLDITVTGAASATVDSIAALMVTALNATAPIAGAAYNSTTQELKVAETTDGIGDKNIIVEFLPPLSTTLWPGAVSIPGFVGAIVDGGSAADAITVTLGADARAKPAYYGQFKTA